MHGVSHFFLLKFIGIQMSFFVLIIVIPHASLIINDGKLRIDSLIFYSCTQYYKK